MTEPIENSMFYEVLFPQTSSDTQAESDLSLRRSIYFHPEPSQDIQDLTWVIFDFETTGLDFDRDRIIELGAQKLKNGEVIDEFESFVSTDIELSEQVQSLTGITPQMLDQQPGPDDVIPRFLQFIQGSVLIAHNAEFDVTFLSRECSRQNLDINWAAFCTLKLARELLPGLESKSLDSLAEHFDLKFEARHRSIGDVKVTISVLKQMLEQEGSHLQKWEHLRPYYVEAKRPA